MGVLHTIEPPYVAVIFTSARTDGDNGYERMADRMSALAAQQPGHLGHESARSDGLGITVSYWETESDAKNWKQISEHLIAQDRGRDTWYSDYSVRIAVVTRAYGMGKSDR